MANNFFAPRPVQPVPSADDRQNHVCPLCGDDRSLCVLVLVDYQTRTRVYGTPNPEWTSHARLKHPHGRIEPRDAVCDECGEWITPVTREEYERSRQA